MEYNTDWKAIQQRFLPTKSKHQIFVRQKDRCSSKAPENPIKADQRMKTSPLTTREISCIQEGLKAYKGDLMAVWKFFVTHRDPTLLPRQWHTAIGTQKSYKLDEAKKRSGGYMIQKEENVKKQVPRLQSSIEKEGCRAEKSGGENNSADVQTDNAAETYVHEAYLAVTEENIVSQVSQVESLEPSMQRKFHRIRVIIRKQYLQVCPQNSHRLSRIIA